jgi:hypothetical protein
MCTSDLLLLTLDRAGIQSALLFPGLDFEDKAQISCAVRDRMDVIVTRNEAVIKHTSFTPIEPPDIVHCLTAP